MSSQRFSFDAWLLGIGMLASTWSQLRIPGLRVGVGEFALAMWIGLQAVRVVARQRNCQLSMPTALVPIYLLGAISIASFSSIEAIARGYVAAGAFPIDILAYILGAVCAFLMASDDDDQRIDLAFFACSSLFIAMFVLTAGIAFFSLDLFLRLVVYEGFRFTGFSENPNQLAFVAIPFLWIAIRTARRASGAKRAVAVIAATCIAAIGVATLSDALFLAWGLTGVCSLAFYTWNWLRRSRPTAGVFMQLFVVIPLVVAMLGIQFSAQISSRMMSFVDGVYSEGDQASDRLSLWRNASDVADRWPLQGLGPGGHSGLLRSLDGMEAHNSFLDWATVAGLPAAISLGFIVLCALAGLLLRTEYELALALSAIVVFSMFHFVLRQPVFWLFLALALRVGWRQQKESATYLRRRQSEAFT